MEWFKSHIPQLSRLSKGKSLASLIFSCFSLSYKTPNCESTLGISNKLLISAPITLVIETNFKDWKEGLLELLPVLKFPLEYLLHNSQISSYANWNTFLVPIRFNISKHSTWIPLSRSVFKISFPSFLCLDLWRLYWKHSMYSSRLSSSPCVILKMSSLTL